MLPTTLASYLVPLINYALGNEPISESKATLHFELRHLHAVSASARVGFTDVSSRISNVQSNHRKGFESSFSPATRSIKAFRPPSFEAFSQARLHSMRFGQSQSLPWKEEEITAPDYESRETLLLLAKMANNAYVMQPGDPYWYDLDGNWNSVCTTSVL